MPPLVLSTAFARGDTGYNDGCRIGKMGIGFLYIMECRANCDLISPYLEHLAFLHNIQLYKSPLRCLIVVGRNGAACFSIFRNNFNLYLRLNEHRIQGETNE